MRRGIRYVAPLLAALTLLLCLPARAGAEYEVPSGVKAALVMEVSSGQRVAELEADVRFGVAGLSRLPAIYAVCGMMDEGRLAADAEISVSERAAGIGGPSAYIKAGEKIGADALLKAAVMISAGDAVTALAEALCGSAEAFTAEMNTRLASLGLDITLGDPLGRDAVFSAEELALLSAALHKSDTFRAYSMLTYEVIEHEDGRKTELASANKLIRSCAGCCGTGTGSSQADGYCGAFTVERGGACYVCVVIGAKNSSERSKAASGMLEYAFANFMPQRLADKGQVFGVIPVQEGRQESVELIAEQDVSVLLPPNTQCEANVKLPETLAAPVYAKDAAGKVEFSQNGKIIATVRLMPREDVPVASVLDYFKLVLLELLH